MCKSSKQEIWTFAGYFIQNTKMKREKNENIVQYYEQEKNDNVKMNNNEYINKNLMCKIHNNRSDNAKMEMEKTKTWGG